MLTSLVPTSHSPPFRYTVYVHLQEGGVARLCTLDWRTPWLTWSFYQLTGHSWLTAFAALQAAPLIFLFYHPVSVAMAEWLADSLTLCTPTQCSQLHPSSGGLKGGGCMRTHSDRRCVFIGRCSDDCMYMHITLVLLESNSYTLHT